MSKMFLSTISQSCISKPSIDTCALHALCSFTCPYATRAVEIEIISGPFYDDKDHEQSRG